MSTNVKNPQKAFPNCKFPLLRRKTRWGHWLQTEGCSKISLWRHHGQEIQGRPGSECLFFTKKLERKLQEVGEAEVPQVTFTWHLVDYV